MIRLFLILLLLCSPAQAASEIHLSNGMTLQPEAYRDLSGWKDDNHGEAVAAMMQSCAAFARQDPKRLQGKGMLAAETSVWQRICEEASMVSFQDPVGARVFFERMFEPYRVLENGSPKGLFTGYYEPVMEASWQQGGPYQHPVYARPQDLVSGEVYPMTRADIENGGLAGKNLELMWAKDPVDLFFTQVQGSGKVVMDTGERVKLQFAGKTNQPYTAIGKVLIAQGALTSANVSAPSIKHWLRNNPQAARGVMHENDAFVFFQVVPDSGDAIGPIGAQNVPLTPERSLAVDRSMIPLGMPIFLQTRLPETPSFAPENYERLMIAQDTGSAITGGIRGDIFFGGGARAEELAGHMKGEGSYVLLLPKALAQKLR